MVFAYFPPMLSSRGDLVAHVTSGSSPATPRTAVLVMNSGATALLCPFFDKCDGVLLNGEDGSQEFHPRDRSGTQSIGDLLLALKPARVICGFISESEKHRLCAAGIDVRLGSCSCAVDELVASFPSLPAA